jgi:hypothetical protein
MRLAFRDVSSEDDERFVLSTWLDSFRTSHSAGLIQMSDFYTVMWPQLQKVCARAGMKTVVAYEETDPEFLYGWLVADPGEQRVPERDGSVRWWPALVVYCFTKQNFRREGVARKLFAHVGIDLSKPFLFGCNTQAASRLSHKVPHARFHPLVARFPKESPA